MPNIEESSVRTRWWDAEAHDRAGIPTGNQSVRPDILIAEDDPMLVWLLMDRLTRLRLTADATDNPQEARRWLEVEDAVLLLDGSVFKQMEIPLGELPKRVVLWSGDDELIQEGRRAGLRSICKTDLENLDRLLREIASAVKGTT